MAYGGGLGVVDAGGALAGASSARAAVVTGRAAIAGEGVQEEIRISMVRAEKEGRTCSLERSCKPYFKELFDRGLIGEEECRTGF